MYGNTHTKCSICGEYTTAGKVECPRCQRSRERREAMFQPLGDLRPVYDNASHAGRPVGYRVVGGPNHGMVLKAVQT